MIRILLSIDPGDHAAGLALYADDGTRRGSHGGYSFAGSLTAHAIRDRDALAELRLLVSATGVRDPGPGCEWAVVVERQTNPNLTRDAADSLAASRRIWRNACLDLGVGATAIHEVAPQSWQGPCGLLGRTARLMGDTKEGSLALATEIVGHAVPSHDEADAVCLGSWFCREGGVEGHFARQAAAKERAKAKRAGGGSRWSEADVAAHLAQHGVAR